MVDQAIFFPCPLRAPCFHRRKGGRLYLLHSPLKWRSPESLDCKKGETRIQPCELEGEGLSSSFHSWISSLLSTGLPLLHRKGGVSDHPCSRDRSITECKEHFQTHRPARANLPLLLPSCEAQILYYYFTDMNVKFTRATYFTNASSFIHCNDILICIL